MDPLSGTLKNRRTQLVHRGQHLRGFEGSEYLKVTVQDIHEGSSTLTP